MIERVVQLDDLVAKWLVERGIARQPGEPTAAFVARGKAELRAMVARLKAESVAT